MIESAEILVFFHVVMETEKRKSPIGEYIDLRQRLVSEWLPETGYQFVDAPELVLLHWRPVGDKKNRYVEIWIPIEKDKS